MTIRNKIEPEEIKKIYKALAVGRVCLTRKELVQKISEYVPCSIPTAYRILKDHQYLFAINHSSNDYRLFDTNPEEIKRSIPVPFQKAEVFLDKLVGFITPKPGSEDFMIQIGTIRDQLRDGIWEDFDDMLILLETKYGDEVKMYIEEGKEIQEYEKQMPKGNFEIQGLLPGEIQKEKDLRVDSPEDVEFIPEAEGVE